MLLSHTDVSLPLFLPPFPSLESMKKKFFLKEGRKDGREGGRKDENLFPQRERDPAVAAVLDNRPEEAGEGEDRARPRPGQGEGRRWNQGAQREKQNLVTDGYRDEGSKASPGPILLSSAVSCSLSRYCFFPVSLTPKAPQEALPRPSSQPSSHRLAAPGSHLDTLNPETQGGGRAHSLPPLHVARLGDGALGMLLRGGGPGVHSHHLLIHVLPGPGPFSSLHQLLLQVGPRTQRM